MTLSVPDAVLAPVHAPAAVHAVALEDAQVSESGEPAVPVEGADRVSVGAGVEGPLGVAVTCTVLDCDDVPPVPEQLSVYVTGPATPGAVTVSLPDAAFAPAHPADALQDPASVTDHVSAMLLETTTVAGAEKVIAGGATEVTLALREMDPPGPEQERV